MYLNRKNSSPYGELFFLAKGKNMSVLDEYLKEYGNLDDIREFYDPHPGWGGAAARFPGSLQEVAIGLDGKRLRLKEAKQRLVEALERTGSGDVFVRPDWIGLQMPSAEDVRRLRCPQHMWMAVRHCEPGKKPEPQVPHATHLRLSDKGLVGIRLTDRLLKT
jgi:hypothetical protein